MTMGKISVLLWYWSRFVYVCVVWKWVGLPGYISQLRGPSHPNLLLQLWDHLSSLFLQHFEPPVCLHVRISSPRLMSSLIFFRQIEDNAVTDYYHWQRKTLMRLGHTQTEAVLTGAGCSHCETLWEEQERVSFRQGQNSLKESSFPTSSKTFEWWRFLAGHILQALHEPQQTTAVIVDPHTQKSISPLLAITNASSPSPHAELPLVRMEPLTIRLLAWKAIPGVSIWIQKVIERGYSLQFNHRPPRFRGLVQTLVLDNKANC